jgi:hypothetical protein
MTLQSDQIVKKWDGDTTQLLSWFIASITELGTGQVAVLKALTELLTAVNKLNDALLARLNENDEPKQPTVQ